MKKRAHPEKSKSSTATMLALLVNSAVGVHHTDTSDSSWDGPANERRLREGETASYYRRAYAWNDPEKDATRKNAYRFIHHEVSADGDVGSANITAARSGIAVLNGGRGGTTIPEGDRRGVYNHLAAHMRDAGEEPPELKDLSELEVWNEMGEDIVFSKMRGAMRASREKALSFSEGKSRQGQGQGQGQGQDWFRIGNQMSSPTGGRQVDIYIYNDIGWWGTTAEGFINELLGLQVDQINLHLNSPGGDVFDGLAIFNALKMHNANVTVMIDALAASIASIIAMAGDEILIAPHGYVMIHNPFGFVIGDANEMRKTADILDQLSGTLADIYAGVGGGKRQDWLRTMNDETWLTAQDALDAGLATGLLERDDEQAQASLRDFGLQSYLHPPKALLRRGSTTDSDSVSDSLNLLTKRDIEAALRDAGMSHSEAKKFVSRGWEGAQAGTIEEGATLRDVEEISESEPTVQEVQPSAEEVIEEVAPSTASTPLAVLRARALQEEDEVFLLLVATTATPIPTPTTS